MNRRNFLKTLGIGAAVAAVPAIALSKPVDGYTVPMDSYPAGISPGVDFETGKDTIFVNGKPYPDLPPTYEAFHELFMDIETKALSEAGLL